MSPGRRRPAFTLVVIIANISIMIIATACATVPDRKDLALEWYGVGNAWLAVQKWAEAGKAFDRAISLDPSLVAASYNAARALVEAGSYDRAIGVADELLARSPGNVRYLSIKAYALWKSGQAQKATETYELAYAQDHFAADVVYNSSVLLLDSGKPAEAADRLAPLLLSRPDDPELLGLDARALAAADRMPEAIAAWETLKATGRMDGGNWELLAGLYIKSGSYAKALEALAECVKAEPKRATAWFAAAKVRLTLADDGKGGLEALSKALEAGFADKEQAAALISEAHLLERVAVVKALAAKGLVEVAGDRPGASDMYPGGKGAL
ncbi:MAG: tetratricopeptide repeat protein [Spirochaetota bacterium]